jgi:preprotein translocase subunit SecF
MIRINFKNNAIFCRWRAQFIAIYATVVIICDGVAFKFKLNVGLKMKGGFKFEAQRA